MVLKSLKSIEAAQRRAERESRKQQRELERRQKEISRMEELERANYEVQVYENYIEVFTSVHKECGNDWNWDEILMSNPPEKPQKTNAQESEAQENFNNFEPGFSDKLLRRGDNKRHELEKAVELAREADNNEFTNDFTAKRVLDPPQDGKTLI